MKKFFWMHIQYYCQKDIPHKYSLYSTWHFNVSRMLHIYCRWSLSEASCELWYDSGKAKYNSFSSILSDKRYDQMIHNKDPLYKQLVAHVIDWQKQSCKTLF